MTFRWAVLVFLVGAGSLCVSAVQSHAAERMPIERLDLQAKLLHTVIRFSTRPPEQLVVAIVASDEAMDIANALSDEFQHLDFNNHPIQVTLVQPEQLDTLPEAVNILYVTPGNAEHLDALAAFAGRREMFTVTGIPHYVERQKIALGFGENQQKPQILLCLPAAKATGYEFKNPKFLNLQTTGKLRIIK